MVVECHTYFKIQAQIQAIKVSCSSLFVLLTSTAIFTGNISRMVKRNRKVRILFIMTYCIKIVLYTEREERTSIF